MPSHQRRRRWRCPRSSTAPGLDQFVDRRGISPGGTSKPSLHYGPRHTRRNSQYGAGLDHLAILPEAYGATTYRRRGRRAGAVTDLTPKSPSKRPVGRDDYRRRRFDDTAGSQASGADDLPAPRRRHTASAGAGPLERNLIIRPGRLVGWGSTRQRITTGREKLAHRRIRLSGRRPAAAALPS